MRLLRAIRRMTPPAVVAGLLCWVGLSAGAAAQDKTVMLKLSSWVPPAHPLNPALIAWAADIEKESGGTIKIDPVPVGTTGQGDRPLRHGARRHRRLRLRQPRLSARPLPDHRRGRNAVPDRPTPRADRPALDDWYRPYAAKEMKDVHVCFAFVLDPGTFHSRSKKIVMPSDIKGDEDPPGQRDAWASSSPCWAAPTCRPRRPRRARCWNAALPTRSPSPGARSCCSASTRW